MSTFLALKHPRSSAISLTVFLALRYIKLGETDTWFGLWRLRAKLQPTAQALAFEQQAYWEQAQENYERVMESALPPHPHPGVRDAEFKLWETHWTLCNVQLGNYESLVHYADETKDVDLMLRSAWKLRSWKKLKETVRKAQSQREPSFDLELSKAYHMIATSEEINVAAIEKICEDATALALRQWRSLPTIVSHSHVPILEASQRFVELQVGRCLFSLCQCRFPNCLSGNRNRRTLLWHCGQAMSNHSPHKIFPTWLRCGEKGFRMSGMIKKHGKTSCSGGA